MLVGTERIIYIIIKIYYIDYYFKEEKMENRKNCFVMLVVVLAFGLTAVSFNGCSNNMDRRLNGTWKYVDESTIEKYNSGYYENSDEDGTLHIQGIYTTDNGKMTYTATHFFGTPFGLDSKWYSKDELEEDLDSYMFNQVSKGFNTKTVEYTINGNTLTWIPNSGETSTMTKISQVGRFTKAISSGKKSASVSKSSGSASTIPGRWSLYEGATRNNPEKMDLLKDGTGIVDGTGITWKVENGRFYLIHPLQAFSSIYNVSGSTLTLTKDDGVILKYKKK